MLLLLAMTRYFGLISQLSPLIFQSSKDVLHLSDEVHKLKTHLDECNHQLARFWKGQLPQGDQVARLRRRLKEQDTLMKEALQRLTSTNRLKEDMELALIQQCK